MYGSDLSGEPSNREDSALNRPPAGMGYMVLITGHKTPPNIAAIANVISWSLSPDGKAFSYVIDQRSWISVQLAVSPLLMTMCRARDSGALRPKWVVFIKPSPRSPMQRGQKDCKSQSHAWFHRNCFPDTLGLMKNEFTDWWHTQLLYRFKPERASAVREQSRHGNPTLTKKLCAADTCWQREMSFPNGVSLGRSIILQGRPHSRGSWSINSVEVFCLSVCFWHFFLFLVCVDFCFVVFIYFKRMHTHKVGWVRRWEGYGRG